MSIDLTSPKRLFLSLICPVSFDDFFSQYWEEKPLYVPKSYGPVGSDGILSLSHRTLRNFIKNLQLQCGRDIDITKCSLNGKKESLNDKGVLSLAKYDRLVTGGQASACFNELQRFQNDLWQLIELLESFFGTLVGSKVIVSPTAAQKSPTPLSFSNAETLVIQTEGESCWVLYSPVSPLSREQSENIAPEHLGEPTHEVLLRAGDFLYLPRGTVYQNGAIVTNTHSTYLAMYTYQQASWGDYLQSIFPSLIKEAMESDVDFRRGLPINFLKSTKLTKNSKFQSVLGILLFKLAKSRLEKFPLPKDLMEKFMEKRLPPYRTDPTLLRSTLPSGTPPDLSCKVRLRCPEHLSFLVADRTYVNENSSCTVHCDLELKDNGCSLDDTASSQLQFLSQSFFESDDSQAIFVFSSLLNSRLHHMMPCQSNQIREHASLALILPIEFLPSLEILKASSDQFMAAASLPLNNPADREQLIRALWSRHLLECIPGFRSQPCKSTKLD